MYSSNIVITLLVASRRHWLTRRPDVNAICCTPGKLSWPNWQSKCCLYLLHCSHDGACCCSAMSAMMMMMMMARCVGSNLAHSDVSKKHSALVFRVWWQVGCNDPWPASSWRTCCYWQFVLTGVCQQCRVVTGSLYWLVCVSNADCNCSSCSTDHWFIWIFWHVCGTLSI